MSKQVNAAIDRAVRESTRRALGQDVTVVLLERHGGGCGMKKGRMPMDDEDMEEADPPCGCHESCPLLAEEGFSSDKPGTGGRFAACMASGKSRELCAYIGRRKYGGRQMASWAAKNREAAVVEAALQEADDAEDAAQLLEKWSDAARAASAAARKSKARGGDWRRAARRAVMNDPGVRQTAWKRGAPIGNARGRGGVPSNVTRSLRKAGMKTGESPDTVRGPRSKAFNQAYEDAMAQGYKRRRSRFL